jgi:solute carrier family 25 carnitine/acylcarnitine transporter 20/29
MTTPSNQNGNDGGKKQQLSGAIAGSGSTFKEALMGLMGGMVFGLVSPVVGHPFDTVKTKMQAEAAYKSFGLFATVKHMYQFDGGIKGFYRGFLPPLVGSVAFRGILFSAYGGTYSACSQYPLVHDEIPYTGGLRGSVFVAAMAAAVARATIESPLDFIKVRFQIGEQAFGDVVSSAAANKGTVLPPTSFLVSTARAFSASPVSFVRHCYTGYPATLFRTMGLLGSFFIMVDYSVRYIPEVVNAPLIGPFFKGGVCATMAWVFAFPFETTKSVIQGDITGKYKNMSGATWKVMADIYRQRGIKGLYRGFGPGAGRSFVANGTSMVVYSWFQESLRA